MNESQMERWERHVQSTAAAFAYPPTPDVAGAVGERLRSRRAERHGRWQPRWAIAAALVLVLLVGLLAVPQVRAGVLEIIRIGVVRIFPQGLEGLPAPTTSPEETVTVTSTSTPLPSVLNLAGETTLAEAHDVVDFPIRLPSYPADLGPPDAVFVQHLDGDAVVLVWLEPGSREDVRMSLHMLTSGMMVDKGGPTIVRETSVNGRRALWTEGPYLLRMQGGSFTSIRLVDGYVLIWEADEITYRLETDLSLEEAVRVAESLE